MKAIDAAIVAHCAWVARFRSVIDGISREVFDPEDIRNDRICAFGTWLHAHPDCFADPDTLQDIKNQHKHFHEIAAQIAIMLRQNFPRDQVELYMGKFNEMSRHLIGQLQQGKHALQG